MVVFNYKNIYKDVSILLIANKSDLVRAREVNTVEGRSLADRFDADFAEVSVELEYNFDQVITWLTNSIKVPPSSPRATNKHETLSSKAVSFVKRILHKRDMKARSCDNLHLL
ncbi:uncharacterized protein B4U80_01205 [Leptotrombidium deliense]|uniref:Uncharacterized protein n=1 Tax=Leptotrombidium deliense TaxID=299467 RepID=A0A443SRU7_9ACAR|nr:uncharacterized protein B4U80_01205 [Leptotrombidium deliense]